MIVHVYIHAYIFDECAKYNLCSIFKVDDGVYSRIRKCQIRHHLYTYTCKHTFKIYNSVFLYKSIFEYLPVSYTHGCFIALKSWTKRLRPLIRNFFIATDLITTLATLVDGPFCTDRFDAVPALSMYSFYNVYWY